MIKGRKTVLVSGAFITFLVFFPSFLLSIASIPNIITESGEFLINSPDIISNLYLNGSYSSSGIVNIFLDDKNIYNSTSIKIKDFDYKEGELWINLSYKKNEWDYDNDGETHVSDIIDFEVKSNATGEQCILWEVSSENGIYQSCQGHESCCRIFELASSGNDTFQINYQKYQNSSKNIVIAQVVNLVNYSVLLSPRAKLKADFYNDLKTFNLTLANIIEKNITLNVDLVNTELNLTAEYDTLDLDEGERTIKVNVEGYSGPNSFSVYLNSAPVEKIIENKTYDLEINSLFTFWINDLNITEDIEIEIEINKDEFYEINSNYDVKTYINKTGYEIYTCEELKKNKCKEWLIAGFDSANLTDNIFKLVQTEFVKEFNGKKVKIFDSKGKTRNFTIQNKLKTNSNSININLDSRIQNINFNDVTGDINLGFEELSDKKYSINPEEINFTNATVTVEAVGTKLYKCKDWNFSEQNCFGSWEFFMNTTPGEIYTFTLTPDDPGFKEIIEVQYAYHLNNNRELISEISEVKELDGIWSEEIREDEFVRVVFEKEISSSNDITLYPEIITGNPYIEVYKKDSNITVATFNSLKNRTYNKVYLLMNGSSDTFDLKILNGSVKFDHIIDPSSYYDPNTNVEQGWDDGTGTTFAEIDDGTREPNIPNTADYVASLANNNVISEFGFPTITETPTHITLWVYTDTGSNAQYTFYLQQAGVTRCSTLVGTATPAGWQFCNWTTPTGDYSAMTIELGTATKNGGGGPTLANVYSAYMEVGYNDEPPSVDLNYPPDNFSTQSTSINFNWTATDDLDTELNCSLTINGTINSTTNVSSLNATPTNYTIHGFNDGTYYWNVTCYDDSFISNTSETRNFTVDTLAPEIINLTPVNYTNYSVSNIIEISANITDISSKINYSYVNITLPNGTIEETNLSNTADKYNVSYTIPDLKGIYNLTFFANDTAANINSTETLFFNVFNTYPNVTNLTSPLNGSTYNQTTIEFNFTITDDYYTNLSNCSLYLNTSGIWQSLGIIYNVTNNTENNITVKVGDGNHKWNVICYDWAGLSDWFTENHTITIDTELEGMVSYQELNIQTPRTRIWNEFDYLGYEDNALTAVGDITWNVLKSNHQRKEFVLGTEDKSNTVDVQVYDTNSESWGNSLELTSGIPNAAYRSFDIAVEDISGDVLVAYESSTAADQIVSYRIWNGTWSEEQNLTTTITASALNWVSLTEKKNSDEIMLLIHNSEASGSGDIYAIPWNGTSFDTTKQSLLSTATTSSTEQHFAFGWEESSGQGIVVYGEGNNLVYRGYTGTWSGTQTVGLGNGLDAVRMCSDKNSDYIGLIFQDAGNDVNVMVWNGAGMLNSLLNDPVQDDSTEPSGLNNINLDCAWKNDGSSAMFAFVDSGSTAINYFNFTPPSTFSTAGLTVTSTSPSFGTGPIRSLRITETQYTNQTMITALDTSEDATMIRWNGSTFKTIENSPLTTDTEVLNGDQEGIMFDWDKYDENPNVTSVNPQNITYNFGVNVNITANISDDYGIYEVTVNITLPNSTVEQYILVDENNDKIYNFTFNNTIFGGVYNYIIIANDTSTHENINNTETGTFNVSDDETPNVFDVRPVLNSEYNISETIEVSANVTDNAALDTVYVTIFIPNTIDQNLTLNSALGAKYNNSFLIPNTLGVYNITFYANDSSGNINNTESTNFTVYDGYPPNVTEIIPQNQSKYTLNDTIQISANITDAIEVAHAYANITYPNGTINQLELTNNTLEDYKFNASFTIPLVSGQYNVTFYANDSSGNVNESETTTFNATDEVYPNILVLGCIPANANVSQTVQCNATIYDNIAIDTVIANVTLPNGTIEQQTYANISTSYHFNFTNSFVPGEHIVLWFANDTSGNVNNTNDYFNVTDVSTPNVTGLIPPNSSVFNVFDSIEILANVTDNVEVSHVYANLTYPNSTTEQIILSNSTTESYKYNNTFTLPSLVGQYTMLFFANDSSSNINSTEDIVFNVTDISAPNVTGLIPSSGSSFNVNTEIEISANITDNVEVAYSYANITLPNGTISQFELTNNTGEEYKFNNSYTIPFLPGTYTIRYFGNDSSSNTNSTETITFTANDISTPNVTGLIPPNSSIFNVSDVIQISSNVTDDVEVAYVYANVTFPNSTEEQVILSNSTTESYKYNNTFTIPTITGQYTILYFANDSSSNINSTESITFNATDFVIPNVTGLIPPNGSVFNVSDTIEISANITDNVEVDYVFVNITYPNGTIAALQLTNSSSEPDKFNSSYTIPTIIGTYTITYIANDSSSNVNDTESIQFNATDYLTPNVSVPLNFSANITETIEIYSNATDNVEVSHVYANITLPNRTITILTLSNSSSESYKFNSSYIVPEILGEFNVTIFVNDTSNNINSTEIYSFTSLDAITPKVIIEQPVESSSFSENSDVLITTNVTDEINVSFVYANITLPNDDIVQANLTDPDSDYVYNVTFTNTSQLGIYTIRIIANDTSNNINETELRNFTIQGIGKPVVTLVSPENNRIFNTPNITFTCNATDSTGLKNISLYHNATEWKINQTENITNNDNESSFNSTLYEGIFIWNCEAYDVADNGAFAANNFTLTVDLTYPNVTALTPSNNSVFNITDTINVSVLITDERSLSSNYVNVTYPNGSTLLYTLVDENVDDTFNYTFVIPEQIGEYILTFFANDTANNINASELIYFNATDNNSPIITTLGCTNVNVNGIAQCNATITDQIEIDTVVANVTYPNGTVEQQTYANLSSDYHFNFSNTFLPGEHIVLWFANDTSGNVQNVNDYFNVTDILSPNVTGLIPSSGSSFNFNTEIQIAANITDNVEVVYSYANITLPNGTISQLELTNNTLEEYKFNNSYTIPFLPGTYTIRYFANDSSSNINSTETITFTANDISIPNVTGLIPPNSSIFNVLDTIQISSNVTDDVEVSYVYANITLPDNSISTLVLSNSSSESYKFNNSYTIPGQVGVFTVRIFANDSSSNINSTEITQFNSTDSDSPIITTLGCIPVNANVSQIVQCNATITDSSVLDTIVANITYPNGTVEQQTYANLSSDYHFNFSARVPGENTVLWFANDTSGNVQNVNDYFNVTDILSPNVTGLIPSNSSVFNVSSTIQISANITDDVEVAYVYANITLPDNSVSTLVLTNSSSESYKFNSSYSLSGEAGIYTLIYFANDSSGNINSSETITFNTTDLITPSIITLGCIPANATEGQTVQCNATITDNGLLENIVANVTLPNGTVQQQTTANLSSEYHFNFTLTEEPGEHTVLWFANDTSGNVNNTNDYFNVSDITPANITNITTSPTLSIIINDTENISVNFSSSEYPINITFNLYNSTGGLVNISGPYMISGQSSLPLNYSVPEDLSDDVYSLNMTATDNSGNENITNLGNITIDTVFPLLENITTIPSLPAFTNKTNFTINFSSEFPINITFNLYNSTELVNVTGPLTINESSELPYLYILPDLNDGNYTLNLTYSDRAGNSNKTSIGNITLDTTPPSVASLGCVPNQPNLSQNTQCNASISDLYLDNVSVSLTYPNGTLENVSLEGDYYFNFTASLPGQHNITWFANDSAGNTNTTTESITVVDSEPPKLVIDYPSNNTNFSVRSVKFNFTATDNYFTSMNCSLFIDGTLNESNTSTINNTITSLIVNNINTGTHTWRIDCLDGSNSLNSSETRTFIVDTDYPNFNSLTTSPDDDNSLDPNLPVNITANITDNLTNIDTVIFQYKLSTNSTYNNLTMSYSSSLYNVTFTPNSSGTYNLRVFANDSVGNYNFSNLVNISVELEKTWTRTPASFDAISTQLNENETMGNITINNTGDYDLNFTLSSDSNNTVFENTTFQLNSGEIIVVEVNDSASSAGITSITYNISTDSDAEPTSRTTTGTLVVAPGEPVLVVTLLQPSSETYSVTQGDTGVQFNARVKNVGEGNATNVSLFFDYPEEWTLTFGADNVSFTKIVPNQSEENNIEISIPSNATIGTFIVVANVTGFNATGANVVDKNLTEEDEVSVSVSAPSAPIGAGGGGGGGGGVTLTPTGPSGGGGGGGSVSKRTDLVGREVIYTTQEVRIVRGNYENITIDILNLYQNAYLTDIELAVEGFFSQYIGIEPIINESKEVFVETKNLFLNSSSPVQTLNFANGDTHSIIVNDVGVGFADITFRSTPVDLRLREQITRKIDVDGDGRNDYAILADSISNGYIDMYVYRLGKPDLDKLQFLEQRDYKMSIFAPSYLLKDLRNITVRVDASLIALNPLIAGFSKRNITEHRTLVFIINEIGEDEARALMQEAREAIHLMQSNGLLVNRTNTLLVEGEDYLDEYEWEQAGETAERIISLKNNGIETLTLVNLIEEGKEKVNKRWVVTPKTEEALELVYRALEREDFEGALERAKEAYTIYLVESQKINWKWFVLYYWWLLIILFIILVFLINKGYRISRVAIIDQKIKGIKKEEEEITNLIKEAQVKSLKEGTMTLNDFSDVMKIYDKRLSKIRFEYLELIQKRSSIGKPSKVLNNLEKEKEELEKLLNKVQREYFNKKIMGKDRFNSIIASYNERMAEVNSEIEKAKKKVKEEKKRSKKKIKKKKHKMKNRKKKRGKK